MRRTRQQAPRPDRVLLEHDQAIPSDRRPFRQKGRKRPRRRELRLNPHLALCSDETTARRGKLLLFSQARCSTPKRNCGLETALRWRGMGVSQSCPRPGPRGVRPGPASEPCFSLCQKGPEPVCPGAKVLAGPRGNPDDLGFRIYSRDVGAAGGLVKADMRS